jgi:hypothetical protein
MDKGILQVRRIIRTQLSPNMWAANNIQRNQLIADSDDVARANRDDVARRYAMMSPSVPQ